MKRFFIAIFATVLIMFSCTGNKANQTEEVPADSVADSIDTTDVDSMEMLITETPMPRAADAMFDDFLFNFLANKKLQKERIVFPLRVTENGKTTTVEKANWKMEHLFMRQGYYTLLFNDDKQMQLMKDTAVSEAVVEKILLSKNQVKNYVFQRIKGAWLLLEIRVTPLQADANSSFLSFYRRFVTDSAFQVKSLSETVDFVGSFTSLRPTKKPVPTHTFLLSGRPTPKATTASMKKDGTMAIFPPYLLNRIVTMGPAIAANIAITAITIIQRLKLLLFFKSSRASR